MLAKREGLFNAHPIAVGVDDTGPNKLATCIISFRLYEELQPSGEWADCSDENLEITAYFYLEKRDGSLNTITLDSLKAALGWDGRDPFWLQDTDLSEHPVQLKLAFEEYNGKTRLKVQFLNPYGSAGGGAVTKAEGAAKTVIRNRLGSKLRALAGPAQPATAKPVTPPKLPPAKPKPPTAPAPSAAATEPEASPMEDECDMQAAWDAFHAAYERMGPKGTPDDCEKQWFTAISTLFPGRQPEELSPAEWAVMRDEGPANIIPF